MLSPSLSGAARRPYPKNIEFFNPELLRFLSESLAARLIKRIYTTKSVPAADRPIEELLSDRELEVFEMIGKGKGSREIASRLKLGIKTVDNYRERIKKKLGIQDAPSLVRHASIWQLERAQTNAPIPMDTTPFLYQQVA